MSLAERFRESHTRRRYEKPLKAIERAPITLLLIEEINRRLFNTPEFLTAFYEKRSQLKSDPNSEYLNIEFDKGDWHFKVLKVNSPNHRGVTTKGFSIDIEPKVDGEVDDNNKIELKVGLESNSSNSTGQYGRLPILPLPYDVGNFSLVNPFVNIGDKTLAPNSLQTRDSIQALLTKLLPTPIRSKIVYKPNLKDFFPEDTDSKKVADLADALDTDENPMSE